MTMMPQHLPGGYCFDGENFFHENREQAIANFYLAPSKAYRLSDDPLPRFADIEIVRSVGSTPLSQHTALDELTAQWWKRLPPGCAYYPGARGAARHLQTLFQLLLGQIEAVEVFQPTALGWTRLPSGEPVYITGSGGIGANGFLPSDHVWVPEGLRTYRLEQASESSLATALNYFGALFGAIPGTTDILLTNTLSSLIFPCFKFAGIESRFPLVLEGPSEFKKTTLACLTSSIYNRKSTPRGCIATLTSTKRALESRGAELRHATLVFDDLFPDGGNATERKMLELIRDVANQLPREARSGSALTGAEMECGAVITAEYFPDCGLSTRTRCLRLVLTEPVPSSLLTPLQATPELLGNVFAAFIAHVATHFDDISAKIKRDFQAYRAQRAQADEPLVKSERLAEIWFILCATIQIFMEKFAPEELQDGGIFQDFQDWVSYKIKWQLSPEALPQSDCVVALLPRIIRENQDLFLFRDGCACISPAQLQDILQRYYLHRIIPRQRIFDSLRRANLLEMDQSGTSTRKIKGRGRCLCINMHRLGWG